MSDEYEDNLRNAVGYSYSKQPLKVAEIVNDLLNQKALDAIEARRDEVADSIIGNTDDVDGEEEYTEFDLDDDIDEEDLEGN
jgi:hypothetical protein